MSLIVADEEFERGAKRIGDISEELNEIFRSYSTIVQVLQKEGICDTAIDTVLADKIDTLTSYMVEFSTISALLTKKTKAFLKDIDEADAYLY